MKEKCRALRVSILIATISFVVCCLLWTPLPSPFPQFAIQFFQMFFGGILGSSFVTLLIYATEYQTQKRITLENIWNEASYINHGFKTIRYLHLDYSKEVVAGYLNEMCDNQSTPFIEIKKKQTYGRKWVDELWKQYQGTIGSNIPGVEFEQILINLRDSQAAAYMDALNQAIDKYISIAETDWNEFNKLFGVVEFFTGKRYYEKMYHNLYEPLYQKRQSIKKQVYPHFWTYKNGENKNKGVILIKLMELQSQFFTVESNQMGTHIYNDFWTDMEKKIEDFRISIYKKGSPDYPDRLNVLNIFSVTDLKQSN